MTKKKYLITGAAGFIGANLTRKLASLRDSQVYALVRPNSNLWRLESLPHIEIIEVDITNSKQLSQAIKKINPTHIAHLATYGVYRDQKDIDKIFQVNLVGSYNLFYVCLSLSNLHLLINTGSVYEYSNLPGARKEEITGKARNLYDAVKISVTSLAQAFALNQKLPLCTFRPFTTYGPYEDNRRLAPAIINQVAQNKQPQIASQAIRDFVYIEDVVNAYLAAFQASEQLSGEVINIGSGRPATVGKFAKLIIKKLDSNIKPIDTKTFTSDNDSCCWANITKAKKLLNWKPQYSLSQGVEKTVNWHKNYHEKSKSKAKSNR